MLLFCPSRRQVQSMSAWIIMGLSLAACGKISLVAKTSAQSVASDGILCAEPPSKGLRYTKFLFVIDKSGSNQMAVNGRPASDPDNVYRADKIEAFYNKHSGDPYMKWGYIEFGSNMGEAAAYISAGGNDQSPIFSQDPSDMRGALSKQRGNPNNGCTPYRAALSLSKVAIKKDMLSHPEEESFYMVFFMSDGMPTDYTDASGGCNGSEAPAGDAAFADVDDLMSINPGFVNFSAAYYGAANFAASEGLRKMSEHGKGKFVDLNATGDFNIDDMLITGPTSEPWMIKRLVVYNLNSAFCDDGSVDVDSDADGICDKDEIRYNEEFAKDPVKLAHMGGKKFDPYNRFSFGGALSDLYQYKRIVFGELLPSCNDDRTDEDFDLATKCEELYLFNSNPEGPTSNWTQKMLRTGDSQNPDSDGDGFIDSLEFFTFKDKSAALDYTNMTRLYNGMKGEQIIAEHRNIRNPTGIRGELAYDTNVEFTGVNDNGQNCYHVSQSHLPLYNTHGLDLAGAGGNESLVTRPGENKVLVYFIQTQEKDPNGRGVYRYSYQTLRYVDAVLGKSPGLQFALPNFKTYVIPAFPQ